MISFFHIRLAIVAILGCLLGGCTVSPAVDAVSWTFDGFTYFLTGKSMTDHAVSAAAGKDCAMTRVVKGETACLPKDEDVAGDRLIFDFGGAQWGEREMAEAGAGDPMSVHASFAGITEPLGGSVAIETRSAALAAVAADTLPMDAFVASAGANADDGVFSARIKSKSSQMPALPDRDTRLWLPVAAGDQ